MKVSAGRCSAVSAFWNLRQIATVTAKGRNATSPALDCTHHSGACPKRCFATALRADPRRLRSLTLGRSGWLLGQSADTQFAAARGNSVPQAATYEETGQALAFGKELPSKLVDAPSAMLVKPGAEDCLWWAIQEPSLLPVSALSIARLTSRRRFVHSLPTRVEPQHRTKKSRIGDSNFLPKQTFVLIRSIHYLNVLFAAGRYVICTVGLASSPDSTWGPSRHEAAIRTAPSLWRSYLVGLNFRCRP